MNIWNNYNFQQEPNKVLTFLKEQEKNLHDKTKGILQQETETFYENADSTYKVYVVCPKLGNYRQKLFEVDHTDEGYQLYTPQEDKYLGPTHKAEDMMGIIRQYIGESDVISIMNRLYEMSHN